MAELHNGLEKSTRTSIRNLRCRLTAAELRERGEQLAELAKEVEDLEEEKKVIAKQKKDEIDHVKVQLVKRRDAVRFGAELRDVPCTWYSDFNRDQIVLVRDDTNEEVTREPMPDSWRQGAFLFSYEEEGSDYESE